MKYLHSKAVVPLLFVYLFFANGLCAYCLSPMGIPLLAASLQPPAAGKQALGVLFPNVNKVAYYTNSSKLHAIASAEKANDWVRMKQLLIDYLAHFGIENFRRDTKMIWKLAKLLELLDGLEVAKPLYRLVLRHHHADINIDQIELYHKTLNEDEIATYVPLDYYYKLVEHQRYVDTMYVPRTQLLNMGHAINSKQADYAPFLAASGNVLYFTSKRERVLREQQRQPNEDIFISQLDNKDWIKSAPFHDINTKQFNEGSLCINQTGDYLYFARCNAPDGLGNCDIYSAQQFVDGTWGNIRPLGPAVNSHAWDSHPFLSRTGDTLYFASDRLGGFGLSDLYFTVKNKRGQWKKAQNLGPVINTCNNEISPFLDAKSRVIYFSSNGQLYNFGSFDIYKSNWTGTYWDTPVNIGPLVNGTGSEYYFTINAAFSHIYYAKSLTEDLEGQDLYSFPLPMEAHPDANVLLRGSLHNKVTGQAFKGIVSIIDLDTGIEIAPKFLSKNGQFSFRLIDKRNYLLVIQGDDFTRIEELFYLSGPKDMARKVATKPISRKIEFKSIEFARSASGITAEMHADLQKVVQFLQAHDVYQLIVSGYTDKTGDQAFNQQLSEKRAQNIRNYLVEEGDITAERIQYAGFGSSKSLVADSVTEKLAINRRVEFHFYLLPEDTDTFVDEKDIYWEGEEEEEAENAEKQAEEK